MAANNKKNTTSAASSPTLGSFTGTTTTASSICNSNAITGSWVGAPAPWSNTGIMTLPANPIAGQTWYDGINYYTYDGRNWINMFTTGQTQAVDNVDITSILEENVYIFSVAALFGKSKTSIDLYNTYIEYLVSLKFYYLPFFTDIQQNMNVSNTVRLQIVSKMIKFLDTITPEQKNEIKRLYEKIVMVQKLKDD